jgi:hypothetical protein
VPPLLLLKSAAPHAGKDLDAMKATAVALKERSLELFKTTLKEYQEREFPGAFNIRRIGSPPIDRTATGPSNTISPFVAV